jgi:hypothetical protein
MSHTTIILFQHGGTGDNRNPTLGFTRAAHRHLCYSTEMELTVGYDPTTSFLPRKYTTCCVTLAFINLEPLDENDSTPSYLRGRSTPLYDSGMGCMMGIEPTKRSSTDSPRTIWVHAPYSFIFRNETIWSGIPNSNRLH